MDAKIALGLPKGVEGKTYADAAKFIENMFKGRNDISSLKTKKTMMFRLRNAQEAERQKKKLVEQKTQQAQAQKAYGGEASKSDVRSYLKQYPEEMEMGRKVEMEHTGSKKEAHKIAADHLKEMLEEGTSANYYAKLKEAGLARELANGGPSEDLDMDASANELPGESPFNESKSGFFNSVGNMFKNEDGSANIGNIAGGVGLATSILGPMISNKRAMNNLSKPNAVNPIQMNTGSIQGNFVNRQQIERNLANQASTSRQAISQQGGDYNQLAAGFDSIHNRTSQALGNTLLQSDLADSQEKTRVQSGRLGIEQFNKQQQFQADQMNVQNQGAYDSQIAAYKQAQGANIGSIGKTLFNYMQATNYAKEFGKSAVLKNT